MGKVDEHGFLSLHRAAGRVYSDTERRDIGRRTKRPRDNQLLFENRVEQERINLH